MQYFVVMLYVSLLNLNNFEKKKNLDNVLMIFLKILYLSQAIRHGSWACDWGFLCLRFVDLLLT